MTTILLRLLFQNSPEQIHYQIHYLLIRKDLRLMD